MTNKQFEICCLWIREVFNSGKTAHERISNKRSIFQKFVFKISGKKGTDYVNLVLEHEKKNE